MHSFPRYCRLAVCLVFALSYWPVKVEGQMPKPVVVARVTEKEINTGQRVIGTVHPLKRSTIGSAVDGRVKTFEVNQGVRVKKGQTLARIRTETLMIEQAAAKAELDLAEHQLTEYQNGSRGEEIAEAAANLQGAESAYRNTQSKLRRIQLLAANNATSEQELDDAEERSAAARFALEATKSLYERIKNGARKETIAQANARVELQRQRVNLIADRIKKYQIVAPFDGFITTEFTEEGAWIKQGDPVVELIQMSEVEIQAPVTAEVAVNLKKGTVVRVEFPEIPNELLTGTIERVVPATASRSRTYPVHIKLKNRIVDDSPLLLAGMLARVDFPAGKREKLPLVPKDALVLNGNQRSVFVVTGRGDTGKVRRIIVELGVALDDRIQVRGKLAVDDLVVVVGNERLIPDTEVRIIREVKSAEAKSTRE